MAVDRTFEMYRFIRSSTRRKNDQNVRTTQIDKSRKHVDNNLDRV